MKPEVKAAGPGASGQGCPRTEGESPLRHISFPQSKTFYLFPNSLALLK